MSNEPDGQKKGLSGCAIAAIIVGGLGVVLVVLVGVGAWLFMASGTGQAMTEMVSTAATAGVGPGPDALRARGCRDAAVVSMKRMMEAVQKMAPDAGPMDASAPAAMVTCIEPSTPLTCDDVAKAYVGADKPGGRFLVSINRQNEIVCDGEYDESGARVGDAEPPPVPPPPG